MPKCRISPPERATGNAARDAEMLCEWGTALVRELTFLFESLTDEFEAKSEDERERSGTIDDTDTDADTETDTEQ